MTFLDFLGLSLLAIVMRNVWYTPRNRAPRMRRR
jgi:hypothetical protein